jgi:hypothetical protein
MDRARSLGRSVAGNAARKGKLPEEPLQSFNVLENVGVELAVSPF